MSKNVINLIPEDFYLPGEILFRNIIRGSLIIMFLFIFFFSYFYSETKRDKLLEEVFTLEQEMIDLQQSISVLDVKKTEAGLIATELDNKKRVQKEAIIWSVLIEDIIGESKESIVIKAIRGSEKKEVTIVGFSLLMEEIVTYSQRLAAYDFIQSAEIEKIEYRREKSSNAESGDLPEGLPYYLFELRCYFP